MRPPLRVLRALILAIPLVVCDGQPTPLETAPNGSLVSATDSPWSGLINPACIQSADQPMLMVWSTRWASALPEATSGGVASPIRLLEHDCLLALSGMSYRDYCDATLNVGLRHVLARDVALGVDVGARAVSITAAGVTVQSRLRIGATLSPTPSLNVGGCWSAIHDKHRATSHELAIGWEYSLDDASSLRVGLHGATSGERSATVGVGHRVADHLSIDGSVELPMDRFGVGASVVTGPVMVDVALAMSSSIGYGLSLGIVTPL